MIAQSNFCGWMVQSCLTTLPCWLHFLLHVRRSSNQPKAVEMAHELHTIEAMNCGYHVYYEIWCADVGEELSCMREVDNYCDSVTVAVVKSGVVVGHVSRMIFLVYSMFLRRASEVGLSAAELPAVGSMALPPANRVGVSRDNLRVSFYFAGIILAVCQSTMKIGPHENFPLYGRNILVGNYQIDFLSPANKHYKILRHRILCWTGPLRCP